MGQHRDRPAEGVVGWVAGRWGGGGVGNDNFQHCCLVHMTNRYFSPQHTRGVYCVTPTNEDSTFLHWKWPFCVGIVDGVKL